MRFVLLVLCLWPSFCTAIEWADSSLTEQVRQALGKQRGTLRPDDFDGLFYLEADRKGIIHLDGIAQLHDLKLLQLANNEIVDLTPLSNLRHLGKLDLRNNTITDLTPLGHLS